MARKVADCLDFPNDSKCSLTIAGEEYAVIPVAVQHAITTHGHKDTPKFREQIRSSLKDER